MVNFSSKNGMNRSSEQAFERDEQDHLAKD